MLKIQNLKKKIQKCSPAADGTWVASVIDQHDNHYTTPTADSVSEIRAKYGRLALSKVVIAFNNELQDTALKTPTLTSGSCRFCYFDRPKTYQIFQKLVLFDLVTETDYPDNTTCFI